MEEVIRDGTPEVAIDFQGNSTNRMLWGENRLIVPIVAGVAVGAWGISRRNLVGNAMAVAGDPSFVIPHRISLHELPNMYQIFPDKKRGCIKLVIDPWKYGQASLLAA